MNHEWIEDDQLLEVLEGVQQARNAVPDWFITAGKASFAWHGLDAELAQLSQDSALYSEAVAIRTEQAEVRALTFAARNLTIELEIGRDRLRGQLVPQQPGEVEIELQGADSHRVPADEFGYFAFDFSPTTSFRLRCRTATNRIVLTDWVTL